MKKVVTKKPTVSEAAKAEFYRTVKDLGTNDLNYRLSVNVKRGHELLERENLLLAEIRAIRAEDKVLAVQHGVMTEILESRR